MTIKKTILITITVIALIKYGFAQNVPLKSIQINDGEGSFQIPGGIGHENDIITIHYYKPINMTSKSRILLVIPGSGRNGDSYRDSWIETSKKYNILILSPSYSKEDYVYADYHLGGTITDIGMEGFCFKKNSNHVFMDEDKVKFIPIKDSSKWIYNDFDRLFKIAKKAVQSKQQEYDIFGHSAGGQILHRFVLLHPNSKANRILASNSGSYTLPEINTDAPFGLKNLGIDNKNLKTSFKKRLVLFLGELDNADEQGGLLLRSPTVDKQGTHRLARGIYFYNRGLYVAKALNTKFEWKLKIVSGVGHNQRKMAKAAAKYLYEN